MSGCIANLCFPNGLAFFLLDTSKRQNYYRSIDVGTSHLAGVCGNWNANPATKTNNNRMHDESPSRGFLKWRIARGDRVIRAVRRLKLLAWQKHRLSKRSGG